MKIKKNKPLLIVFGTDCELVYFSARKWGVTMTTLKNTKQVSFDYLLLGNKANFATLFDHNIRNYRSFLSCLPSQHSRYYRNWYDDICLKKIILVQGDSSQTLLVDYDNMDVIGGNGFPLNREFCFRGTSKNYNKKVEVVMDTNRRIKIATGKTSVLDWMKSRFVDTAIMVVGFAVITLGIAAMSDSAFAAEPEGRDVAVASQDTLPQQGNIQFLGLLTERQASEVARPKDSMLLKINRRLLSGPGRSPREFYMLSKRINPMEGEMLADSQDGQWNTFNLFQAALAAEGNRTPVQVKQLESRMEQIVRDMQQKLESSDAADEGADARKLTEKLFRYLHENVLTAKYDINCTDPATVLETGKYNCVSATLFFNVLAERAGINACALEMPGHALSRVKHQTLAGANSFDLETTYAGWFSLPNEEQRRAATESKIASNSAPQTYTVAKPVINDQNSSMKKIRELTPVQFVAIVYYNKGFDYLKAERYADAVNANAKALTLDPQNENAWKNLLAAINNWAIACIDKDQNRFDLAVELLEYGLQIDETYDMFRTNMRSVFCQWIQSLQKEGRANDAMTVYHFAIERLPNDEVLKSLVETK